MTNAEKIRQMSDEELAHAIMCPNEFMSADIKCLVDVKCCECTLDWLREEAE